ncbi:hypothetical protein BLNAU_23162 [Blattamonas nauphoetae]|uniref:Uncharacterized protein n=1 Tax=Blattamonas nauphoetae TaxID=2049346 RepID=A0ABQ9WR21_9EUKA|nr:hypothetical protein BLNAU_23162 [Blattamonas nauphoetae]
MVVLDQSTIYNSLVTLVKADYPFSNALQDKAVQFLKNLEPKWNERDLAAMLVRDLVHSLDGSPSGFVDSILTLLSSHHSKVVAAAMSLLPKISIASSPTIRSSFVKLNLINKVLATVQPNTLPIAKNEEIFNNHIEIIKKCLDLAQPVRLIALGVTDAVDRFNHREMIFQKVVLPLSPFVAFLITNRYILNEDLLDSLTSLLYIHIDIGPYHRPTLKFVLASPIAVGLSSCLSIVERDYDLWTILINIHNSLGEWKGEGPEVTQSAKLMMQALISEGFEDTLEQILMNDKDGDFGIHLVDCCNSILQLLGSNVEISED